MKISIEQDRTALPDDRKETNTHRRGEDETPTPEHPETRSIAPPLEQPFQPRKQRWSGWLVFALLLAAVGGFSAWWLLRPIPVQVVFPEKRTVTESIAASGLVAGRRETGVGAQMQGVVAELYVQKGERVRKGQLLARVRNEAVVSQARQAEQILQTARAQQKQAETGVLPSEIAAARARVSQAAESLNERAAAIARAQADVQQVNAKIEADQAQMQQAQAAVKQAEARFDLAKITLDRYRELYRQEAIARQMLDQAEADCRVAEADVEAARQSVGAARFQIEADQAARESALRLVEAAQSQQRAAESALAAARADARTLEQQPRPEAVAVARRHVQEAEAALRVAQDQAQYAFVRAPFAGTVTEIVTETGAAIGAGGVLNLVETSLPEIRVNIDENSLADLKTGQRAVITSSAYRDAEIEGRVTRIGARVDAARGTVEIALIPVFRAEWLRPGQTVNVNLIIHEQMDRLIVPGTAVRLEADRRVVLVARNGRAIAVPVLVGPVEGDRVTILGGLTSKDVVVRNAETASPGARVRVTAGR